MLSNGVLITFVYSSEAISSPNWYLWLEVLHKTNKQVFSIAFWKINVLLSILKNTIIKINIILPIIWFHNYVIVTHLILIILHTLRIHCIIRVWRKLLKIRKHCIEEAAPAQINTIKKQRCIRKQLLCLLYKLLRRMVRIWIYKWEYLYGGSKLKLKTTLCCWT